MDEQITRNPSGSRILGQDDRWMSRQLRNAVATRKSPPKPSAADAAPPSGSRILGQDDRWMSRQLRNAVATRKSPPKLGAADAAPPFRLSNPRSG